jgi:hypothetical protein
MDRGAPLMLRTPWGGSWRASKAPALQVNVGGCPDEVNSRFFSAGLSDPLTRVHGMQNASTMGYRLVEHFAAVPLQ